MSWSAHPIAVLGLTVLGLAGCEAGLGPMRTLQPEPNPMDATDPLWSSAPHRERPRAICVSEAHGKAWVMNGGVEDDPAKTVAVVDLEREALREKIELGASPWGCALDPSERFLVVTLRYSDRAIVLDAETDARVGEIAVPFYTEGVLWSPDGARIYFANRWTDSVFWVEVRTSPDFRLLRGLAEPLVPPLGVHVGDNPGPLAWSEDGKRLFVGLVAGAALSVVDVESGRLVDADDDPRTTSVGAPRGYSRIELNSPVGGLAVAGPHIFVTDAGRGTGAPPADGRDLDDDGRPGDGTANVMFQDLQNEIAVFDTRTLKELHRYTSDSICCADFRDVDPGRPERGLELPDPDPWPPSRAALLPPRETWIVAGALPEAITVRDGVLWVAFAGSNEVQSFDVAEDGRLSPKQTAGQLYLTGYNPKALAAYRDRILTVDRLAESVSILRPPALQGTQVVVGDLSAGRFPASDAEIGEAVNEMTAAFTIDGDQTCVHCHRDNGAIARPVMMPLQEDHLWGARNVPAQRGLFDTRPWFFESAMDETNFFPVLNEFARRENFCCERLDPTIWSNYPSEESCEIDPPPEGCQHVLDCDQNPPPECAERPYAHGAALRRSTFIRQAAHRLLGRDETFGDALYTQAGAGERRSIPLDFNGVTRAIGLFMLRTPRLLPNPNRTLDARLAARGRRIFEDPSVGCVNCHPLPLTTTAARPVRFSPFDMPIRFPPVVSPSRSPRGDDASRITPGFIGTFPSAVQSPAGLHLGATLLKGLWDRPSTRFLHDGRARSLREVLATPGHQALAPGEQGRNERDGVFDTHGGTSHLSRYELEDLIFFLHTL